MAVWLTRTFAVAALGLSLAGGYFAFRQEPVSEPLLVIEPTERDLGTVHLGSHPITFRIRNPAARDRRIIGLAEG
jgi:hypothetical protein